MVYDQGNIGSKCGLFIWDFACFFPDLVGLEVWALILTWYIMGIEGFQTKPWALRALGLDCRRETRLKGF